MKKYLLISLFLLGVLSCSDSKPTNMKDKANIHLVVSISVKPELRNQLMNALDVMVSETRKEKGCVAYYLVEEEAVPNQFYLIEEWATQEDLESHSNSSHFKEYIKATEGIIESSVIKRSKLIY